jgi:hypothetical protein
LEDEFVARGHAVDWHVHLDQPRNPHVHALVSFPTWDTKGFAPADKNWDRRAWLVSLHAVWRRHCDRQGLTASSDPGRGGGSLHLGGAHALSKRGVITRQGQRLAALRALSTVRRPHKWPAWLRVRLRRRDNVGRKRQRVRERVFRDR